MMSLVISVVFLLALISIGCGSSSERKGLDGGPVEVGDAAPDFRLPDQNGNEVSLKNYLGEKVVVLYFYPKDNTSVCTKQACYFRDSYEQFKEAGAEVIGVSSDSIESHKSFAAEHELPFILLSDEGGKLRELYGVPSKLFLPGRVTYVIDRKGTVRHVFSSMMNAQSHIEEAMRIVKSLGGQEDQEA
jgi:peroxiredoxin Q/BCP